jgi:hypothetical protein
MLHPLSQTLSKAIASKPDSDWGAHAPLLSNWNADFQPVRQKNNRRLTCDALRAPFASTVIDRRYKTIHLPNNF